MPARKSSKLLVEAENDCMILHNILCGLHLDVCDRTKASILNQPVGIIIDRKSNRLDNQNVV